MDGEKQVSTTPALNLPSFRISFESQLAGLPPEVQAAHRTTFNAITDIYQGITALNSKVEGVKSSVASTAGSTSGASETIVIGNSTSPSIGAVNDQSGVTAYTTLQSDYGSEIQLNDASPIAVTLSTLSTNPGIQLPYFTTINNLGTGTATLTPPSPALINGASSLAVPGGQFAIIYFDGTNFTANLGASGSAGVTQIVAGTGITISPVGGTGAVTVNATGGSGGVSSLNALTGALSLTSTGSTITITPSGSTIDLESTVSGYNLGGSLPIHNIAFGIRHSFYLHHLEKKG